MGVSKESQSGINPLGRLAGSLLRGRSRFCRAESGQLPAR